MGGGCGGICVVVTLGEHLISRYERSDCLLFAVESKPKLTFPRCSCWAVVLVFCLHCSLCSNDMLSNKFVIRPLMCLSHSSRVYSLSVSVIFSLNKVEMRLHVASGDVFLCESSALYMLVSHWSVLCMPLSVCLRQCVRRWINDLCAGHVFERMCSSAM
jgi:hypothetical protein